MAAIGCAIVTTFNRTIEELKFNSNRVEKLGKCTFNRTIEELKSLKAYYDKQEQLAFNRTIEELKYIFLNKIIIENSLLIAP